MSKMIQVRNVPEEIHRELKARAARSGMTLSDFLLRELVHLASGPELEAVLARARARPRPSVTQDPAAVLRDERASRP